MNQNSIPIPQLGAATALVQLLSENPTLPPASWSLDQYTGALHGHAHNASFEVLTQYAEVLGGAIRPGGDYTYQGQMVRPHRLHATWRDVPVEVVVVLPAPMVAQVAA
ncbi:hypothetical protein [Streptomyces sp. Wh19]|uniref:hypothetical protein n=1 Tax=Streptomyces sp. Wh19 TaxID=3076629 RepID=UPI002958D0D7|nr:hypothetical protein [Streptomyces sp. Wh19]MDV9194353.1 hypothetical protein [Streptomyces sp. Wh19]